MTTQLQRSFKILLIGDDCLDIYQFGTVERISPEAPVPVFEPGREESRPGMASNVAENLRVLGCDVTTMLGDQSKKTRLIDLRSGQQILRIDQDSRSAAIKLQTRIPQTFDAVVICDYNKGSIDYKLVKEIRKEFVGPIFIDTKKSNLAKFQNCFVKINEKEYEARTSVNDQLIVTLGERGAVYHNSGQVLYFEAKKVGVSDVCGAGDTFLSALTYRYLCAGDMSDAIEFAMAAASVTVRHLGVYAPTMEEINASIR